MSFEGVDADREFYVELFNNSTGATQTPLVPTMSPTNATMAPTDQGDVYGSTYSYVCQDPSAEAMACPLNCTSLEACMDCDCQIVQLEDTGGPWGQFVDVLLCLLPIIYLIYATVKKNPTPTTTSLPTSAVIMFLVRVMYLGSNPLLTSACVVLGAHEAITPLTIMAGAITLFETMEATKCLPYMMREMKALTAGHPVAEVMLIFGFATLVEGASGFGTPVALGAPMLVSTGHPPLESVVLLLLFNTFATVWGAVGTPLWFGFGELGLTEDDFLEISLRAGVAMTFSAFILLPFIICILVPFAVVKKNIIFLLLSIATVMGPVLGLASINYEFPSLIGGLVGCGLTSVLIKFKVGLAPYEEEEEAPAEGEDLEATEVAPVQMDCLMEMTDVARGYHKQISDLTEAAPNKSAVAAPPEMPVAAAPAAASAATASDDDDIAAEKKEAAMNTSIEVNAELEVVATAEEDTTWTGEDKKMEPPLVEEDAKKQSTTSMDEQSKKSLTRSQIMRQSAMSQEDALLGPRKTWKEGYLFETIMRTFPIWGVVILLILTRVQTFKIKGYLTKLDPHWEVQFGTYGDFRLSASIVFQLRHILTYPNLNWKYELLYVPFLIPFVFISLITMVIFRKDLTCKPQEIASTVVNRLSSPFVALLGALILVQLMIKTDVESPAYILGVTLADWLREGFIVISPILGALGSFFSGSTTVSNLTFGEIQQIAADEIGTDANTMLALQAMGASAGNGICLNNIISALAVVGLNVSEGQILMRTAKYVFASTTIATVVMLCFFFRF